MSTLDNFEENLKNICKQYAKNEGNSEKYSLLVSKENYPKVQNLLKQNGMTFVVRDSEIYSEIKKRLLWSSWLVSFFKMPFCIEKTSTLHCTNGPKYFDKRRIKKHKTSILQDNNSVENSTQMRNEKPLLRRKASKKMGCSALMRIVILRTFPEYCIQGVKSLKEEKQRLMKQLKEKLKNDPTSVVAETLYQISFSTAAGHCHPVWTSFTAQHIDPALKNEIRNLVERGITNVQTIKVLLCKWVKENIGDVNNSSRAYWPTKKTIRNHILKYVSSVRVNRQNNKQNKTISKTRIKKQRTKRDYSYQSNSMQLQPMMEVYDSSTDIPAAEYDESDHQEQSNVPISGIHNLIKTIYDRSFLLHYDCRDPVLYSKLQEVLNIMNNCIET